MSNTESVLNYITEKGENVTLTEIMAHCLLSYPDACEIVDKLAKQGKIVLVDRMHYRLKSQEKTNDRSRNPYRRYFD